MRMTKIIKRVERVDCSSIGDELKNGLIFPYVIRSLPWKEIDIKRNAEVSIVQKIVEKEVIFEVNAKFYTCQDMETNGYGVYKFDVVGGKTIIVGSGKRPFVETSVRKIYPEKASDAQWNEVKIQWKTKFPIPEI